MKRTLHVRPLTSEKRAAAGFTLIEMMIALVAGAFAVAGVYYLNGVSSRSFAEQMRISETQMSLRSAMEQLRRDFSRAGYLASSNSDFVPDCLGNFNSNTGGAESIAASTVRSLRINFNGSTSSDATVNTLLAPATNSTRADSVDAWGNYATPEAYLVDPLGSSTLTITFQPDSEAFRRSFFDPVANNGTGTFNRQRFLDTFTRGRMVRIENEGRYFFRTIDSNFAPAVAAIPLAPGSAWPSVTFTTALPTCFVATTWSSIAPVLHVNYALVPDSAAGLARLQSAATAGGTAIPGTRRTLLVRQEMLDTAGAASTVVAGSQRVLLDYAVEFAVDAYVNASGPAAPPPPAAAVTPTWQLVRGAGLAAQNLQSQNYRSLMVTLSARSAEVDPKLPTMPRVNFNNATPGILDSPLLTVQVITPGNALVLNARTRTLRSEIFLQNQ